MINIYKRLIGNYKTIHADCKINKNEYLELTQYPDGDTLISVRNKHTFNDEDPCVCISKEDLNKLLEELK